MREKALNGLFALKLPSITIPEKSLSGGMTMADKLEVSFDYGAPQLVTICDKADCKDVAPTPIWPVIVISIDKSATVNVRKISIDDQLRGIQHE